MNQTKKRIYHKIYYQNNKGYFTERNQEYLFFLKQREEELKNLSVDDLLKEVGYFGKD